LSKKWTKLAWQRKKWGVSEVLKKFRDLDGFNQPKWIYGYNQKKTSETIPVWI
jgi:hypothetical protein